MGTRLVRFVVAIVTFGAWTTMANAAAPIVSAALRPDPPEVGDNVLDLSVKDDKGQPVEQVVVSAKVSMAAMGTMPQMNQKTEVAAKGEGHFEIGFKLAMEGTWTVGLVVEAHGERRAYEGSVTTGIPGIVLRADESRAGGDGGATDLALGPSRLQLLGVRFAQAKVIPLTRLVRASGLVEADNTNRAEVTLRYNGYVEKQLRGRVGDSVKAGTPLFTVNSPDLIAAENEFLLAHGAMGAGIAAQALHASTVERLRTYGLSAADLARLRQRGAPDRVATITAPISGTILDINVREGSSFAQGQVLYLVGDLSKTYIVGRVSQKDLGLLKAGQEVSVVQPDTGGAGTRGRIDLIYPDVNAGDGAGSVRVVPLAPMPDLRPGLFVDLLFPVDLGARLVVPTTAVLYSGNHRYAFIDHGGGHLEPREIATGVTADEWTEVTRGIKDGERVVASGTFLLSSEAQLRSALPKWTAP